jgi:acyl-coenzyme A thioesterase PaaI-like protein
MALLTQNPAKPGVSVEINTTYVRAANRDDTVIIKAKLVDPLLVQLGSRDHRNCS